jgi:hypothetical protein
MRFDTVAMPPAQFAQWLASARASTASLDAAGYAALAKPGVAASAPRSATSRPTCSNDSLHVDEARRRGQRADDGDGVTCSAS